MLNKQATSIRLTPEAKRLLHILSDHLGLSQAAVLELIIRERARRERIMPEVRHDQTVSAVS